MGNPSIRAKRSLTQRLLDNQKAYGAVPPDVPGALLAWLEKQYPARCRFRGEDELSHERYAGKVELVADLRNIFERYMAPEVTAGEDAEFRQPEPASFHEQEID